MTRVADLLVDLLRAEGVRSVFGVAGDSLNAVTDSLRPRDDIRWVHMRHEEAAAFAAGAVAQLTGRLGACAGSCGPGNLHLINGLYDAHRSRAPVLAIAAQVPSPEIGSEYFQETHPEEVFRECSHFRGVVSSPEMLEPVTREAIRVAKAEHGVAVVVLPGDIAERSVVPGPAPRSPPTLAPPSADPAPSGPELDRLVELLNGARKVTILAGGGCRDARDEVLALAARLRAPIVHTLRAKEFLEHDNPYDVGMTGLIGFSSGYHAMGDADLLVLLGTDFPYRQFYPATVRKVQVDRDARHLGRRTPVDLGVVADVGSTVRAALPRLTPKADSGHLTQSMAHYGQSRRALDELAVGETGSVPLHPQFVARVLDELAPDDAIFTCDVGLPTVWAARYLRLGGRRRLVGSFWHGSMANALPQAIGAQRAFPDRRVISLSGDGGLSMLLGELLTLRQVDLPVKIVVFDNRSLGFVQLEQKSAGFLESGVDLVNPNFAELASSAGLLGLRAERPEEVRPMLGEMLAHPGPALLDAVVARQEIVMPPTIEPSMVKGFGLWLIKAILSGRGDEIVDLAKVNLFR